MRMGDRFAIKRITPTSGRHRQPCRLESIGILSSGHCVRRPCRSGGCPAVPSRATRPPPGFHRRPDVRGTPASDRHALVRLVGSVGDLPIKARSSAPAETPTPPAHGWRRSRGSAGRWGRNWPDIALRRPAPSRVDWPVCVWTTPDTDARRLSVGTGTYPSSVLTDRNRSFAERHRAPQRRADLR